MDKLVPQSISLVIASLLKCNGIIHVIILDKIADNTGPKPFNIGRKPRRRTRVWAFWDYTNTMVWERMSARQATPWSHKFTIWKSLLVLPLEHFRLI